MDRTRSAVARAFTKAKRSRRAAYQTLITALQGGYAPAPTDRLEAAFHDACERAARLKQELHTGGHTA